MCGRFSEKSDLKKLAGELGVTLGKIAGRRPRYNIAPSQPVLGFIHEGTRKADIFQWGLVPAWAREPLTGQRMINARAETLTEKPSFRGLIRSSRCLIAADGFYEWKRTALGKQAYYIQMKDGRAFTFGGLWSDWCSADGSEIRSCAIITTAPNRLMRPIHDRMPVVIGKRDRDRWLDPKVHHPADLQPLFQPFDEREMTAYPVSTFVDFSENEGPDCLKPAQLL